MQEGVGREDDEHKEDPLLQRVLLFFLVYPELTALIVLMILFVVGFLLAR